MAWFGFWFRKIAVFGSGLFAKTTWKIRRIQHTIFPNTVRRIVFFYCLLRIQFHTTPQVRCLWCVIKIGVLEKQCENVVNIGPLRFDMDIERSKLTDVSEWWRRSSISHQLGSISSNQAISGPMTGLTIPTLTSYHNHIHIIRSHPLTAGQNTQLTLYSILLSYIYTETQKKILYPMLNKSDWTFLICFEHFI